jgi:hypothetical protein
VRDPLLDDDPEISAAQAAVFALLIKGHSEISQRANPCTVSPITVRFKNLLEAFSDAHRKAETLYRAQSSEDFERFTRLLNDFRHARERHRQSQEELADDFNLLEVLRLTGKEVRHSMVLAWLLDRDLESHGTHAQGRLGFRLFLRQFGLPAEYADAQYWVRREVAGDESVVDVEVAARGQFLIHVENKIWSSEGTDQTDREWADVQRRAVSLGIHPSRRDAPIHALFLTPDKVVAINNNFVAISWRGVVRVLEKFAEQAKPSDVKLIARHYARAISMFIIRQGAERLRLALAVRLCRALMCRQRCS